MNSSMIRQQAASVAPARWHGLSIYRYSTFDLFDVKPVFAFGTISEY
jgi:hypothetical protein